MVSHLQTISYNLHLMVLLKKQLRVKSSGIPGSGKGLYTRVAIQKGTHVVEYKGKVTDWKHVNHKNGRNPYIFYVTRNYVIDAQSYPSALARYANDARGLTKSSKLINNCIYETQGKKVYITAIKNIPAGSELLVSYGKEYWDVIREYKKAGVL